jgi:hypothetical protein
VINADWKEFWYHAVKRNGTITYLTSVLIPLEERILIPHSNLPAEHVVCGGGQAKEEKEKSTGL